MEIQPKKHSKINIIMGSLVLVIVLLCGAIISIKMGLIGKPDLKWHYNVTSVEVGTELDFSKLITIDVPTKSVVITDNQVKQNNPGTYVITYNVVTEKGHIYTIDTSLTVFKDNVAPKFEVTDDLSKDAFGLGEQYDYDKVLKSFKAIDNIEGDITDSAELVSDDFNPYAEGMYHLVFNVSDMSGNEATLQIPLHVTFTVYAKALATVLTVLPTDNIQKAINGDAYVEGTDLVIIQIQYKDGAVYSLAYDDIIGWFGGNQQSILNLEDEYGVILDFSDYSYFEYSDEDISNAIIASLYLP
jgi:hypothetical protein